MFRFNLEYSSFVKFLIWIKLLLLFVCWFYFCPIFFPLASSSSSCYDGFFKFHVLYFPIIKDFSALLYIHEYNLNLAYFLWNGVYNGGIGFILLFEKIAYNYSNILFSIIGYPDYFFIIYILFLLIFIIYNSHMLNYLNFQKLIKFIIFGLFIEIWLLLQILVFDTSFLVGNSQFLVSPWIIFFKIFVCIIAICIFFVMLDYFFFESLVLNYLF